MKNVSVNLLNEVCENYINKDIEKVIWKDGSETTGKDLYLGIVNFKVTVCEKNSLWSAEVNYAKEIVFK